MLVNDDSMSYDVCLFCLLAKNQEISTHSRRHNSGGGDGNGELVMVMVMVENSWNLLCVCFSLLSKF